PAASGEFFFFQADDGIRDRTVTGVQTCALPISAQEQQTRQWALFLHLSILAGFVVPFAGLIVPIVIWQLKKAELPGIDVHGKNEIGRASCRERVWSGVGGGAGEERRERSSDMYR